MGKNKDRLLTKSIPWADSILEQVINLPAAGGEDLQSTAEAQVLAVENLLKMVNRKVAENRGEGEYVWKKSSIKTFPACIITVKQTTASKSPTILQLSSSQVDLSTVDASFFVGITGTFTNTSGSTFNVKILSESQLEANSSTYTYTYDASTQQIAFQTNFIQCTWSNWSRGASNELTFVTFVISDDPNVYPSDGEQDGYWYELVEEGIDFSNTAVKKIAVDKFTMAANTAGSSGIRINHSLGELPRAAVIIGEITKCANTNSNYFNVHTCVMINLSNKHGAQVSIGYNYQNTEKRVALVSDSAWSNPSETQVQYYDGSSYTILPAGIEFTLITMA